MKKVLVIVIAAMCVMSCGQRKAAKSQETKKAACQKENTEVVEHACCGHHGAEGCPEEITKAKVEEATQKVEEACEKVEKAAEKVESEGVKIEQMGEKQRRERPRPVPNPYKK